MTCCLRSRENSKRHSVDQSEKAAQGLNAQLNRMETAFFDLKVAIGQTGIVDFFSDAIQGATKFLNVLTQGIGVSQQSAIEKQVQLIANMREELASLNDKKNIPFGEIFLFDKRQADFLEQRIEDATDDLAKMQAEAQKTAESVNVLAEETGDLGEELGNLSRQWRRWWIWRWDKKACGRHGQDAQGSF